MGEEDKFPVEVFQAASWSYDEDAEMHPGSVILQGRFDHCFTITVQTQEQADALLAVLAQVEIIDETPVH